MIQYITIVYVSSIYFLSPIYPYFVLDFDVLFRNFNVGVCCFFFKTEGKASFLFSKMNKFAVHECTSLNRLTLV